jgi:RNA polymerase sigma-70 factor (ECF subfamily)
MVVDMSDLESIWERLHVRLFRFIRARVEDDASAEDILQEVFLRIHSRMDSLADSSRLDSWVYQIARHAVIDHYRRRRELVEIPETLVDEAMIEEPDEADILASSLREMVEALPEPYRQALLLTEYQGLTQTELAEQLGISLSGAKSRVQRARQRIKDGLLSCCHFEFDRYGRVIEYWEHCCCCAGGSATGFVVFQGQ